MNTPTMNEVTQRVKDLLSKKGIRVVITSHHNPDGDAIGSMLGLYHVLTNVGISVEMVSPNDFPDFLAWLPGSDKIINFSRKKKTAIRLINEANVLFALDYNGFARLEDMEISVKESPAKKVLVDHHPYPENTFDIMISDVMVSSTAELIYELAVNVFGEKDICLNSASCLFAGIMTDTGSFSYGCSRPRTFEIVAKLISVGVKIETVQHLVYNNFSEGRMKLLGYSLCNKMRVFNDLKSAYISLTREELKKYKYSIGDTEGLVNLPLSIKGIVFSALFVENVDFVKVSLRSRGDFPVNEVAQNYFNGGGHKNAAGGKSFTNLASAEEKFVEIVNIYKSKLG